MIHTFTCNGYTLALDVYSGAVHVVDEAAAALIRLREHHGREEAGRLFLCAYPDTLPVELSAGLQQIDALEKAGKL